MQINAGDTYLQIRTNPGYGPDYSANISFIYYIADALQKIM